MLREDTEALILAQAEAYQAATLRFGRGKVESHLLPPVGSPDPLATSGRRGSHNPSLYSGGTIGQPTGGYGKPSVMSHYIGIKVLAGGVPTGTAASKRRKA